jgi:excisionase family DNA binding protein
MSVGDVAQLSGLSKKTVLRALAAGDLVGSKVRSRWLVWPDDFRAWIDGGRRMQEAPAMTDEGRVGSADRLRAIERAA